jgi:membrane-associated phospholipid phosphatase
VSHGVGTVEPVAGDRRRIRYRSLPRALRRPALAVVVAAAFLAAALGVRYAGEAYPRWLDKTSLALARDRLSVLREPARLLIGLFDPVPLTVLIVVLTAVCAALGRWRLAVLAVAGPVLTGVLTTALKPVVERTKEGDLAYPSGHMGSAVALALVVALLIVSLAGLRRWAAVAVLVAVPAAVGAAVGLAMTVTDYHYLTDAVGGSCVAVAVVLSVAVLVDRWPPRRRRTGMDPDAGGNVGGPLCD